MKGSYMNLADKSFKFIRYAFLSLPLTFTFFKIIFLMKNEFLEKSYGHFL